jgi:hypothetical protein
LFSVFITLLTATYVRKQYKQNALLRFHGNNLHANASQFYVIHNLHTLFMLKCVVQTATPVHCKFYWKAHYVRPVLWKPAGFVVAIYLRATLREKSSLPAGIWLHW